MVHFTLRLWRFTPGFCTDTDHQSDGLGSCGPCTPAVSLGTPSPSSPSGPTPTSGPPRYRYGKRTSLGGLDGDTPFPLSGRKLRVGLVDTLEPVSGSVERLS